jgi:hypothetical protein
MLHAGLDLSRRKPDAGLLSEAGEIVEEWARTRGRGHARSPLSVVAGARPSIGGGSPSGDLSDGADERADARGDRHRERPRRRPGPSRATAARVPPVPARDSCGPAIVIEMPRRRRAVARPTGGGPVPRARRGR